MPNETSAQSKHVCQCGDPSCDVAPVPGNTEETMSGAELIAVERCMDALLEYGQHTPFCGSHTAAACDCGWQAWQIRAERHV